MLASHRSTRYVGRVLIVHGSRRCGTGTIVHGVVRRRGHGFLESGPGGQQAAVWSE